MDATELGVEVLLGYLRILYRADITGHASGPDLVLAMASRWPWTPYYYDEVLYLEASECVKMGCGWWWGRYRASQR